MKDVNLYTTLCLMNVLLGAATPATPRHIFPVELAIRLDWARPPWLTLQRLRFSHSRYGPGSGNMLRLRTGRLCFISSRLWWCRSAGVTLTTPTGGTPTYNQSPIGLQAAGSRRATGISSCQTGAEPVHGSIVTRGLSFCSALLTSRGNSQGSNV